MNNHSISLVFFPTKYPQKKSGEDKILDGQGMISIFPNSWQCLTEVANLIYKLHMFKWKKQSRAGFSVKKPIFGDVTITWNLKKRLKFREAKKTYWTGRFCLAQNRHG